MELAQQLVIIMIGKQLINNVQEVMIPYVFKFCFSIEILEIFEQNLHVETLKHSTKSAQGEAYWLPGYCSI